MVVARDSAMVDSDESRLPLRAAVIEAGTRWAGGQRDLLRLVTKLDASGEWAADGAISSAHWVAAALDVELCTAREWLRIGRALITLGDINRSFQQGSLSYSKVRALTRIATPSTQSELCALAERVPAARLGRELAAWLGRHETAEQTEARHHAARRFSARVDEYGMIVGSFRLAPVEGAKITTGIDALVVRHQPQRRSADASGSGGGSRWPSLPQQRADALVELIDGGGAAITTEIVLHVRADGCSLDDGTPVAGSVVERIAPEAFLRALIHDADSKPINASGRQRHPTTRQRRVVKARDKVCQDCGSTELLQYAHDPDYAESHRTLVDETGLRCWTCHRLRHGKRAAKS